MDQIKVNLVEPRCCYGVSISFSWIPSKIKRSPRNTGTRAHMYSKVSLHLNMFACSECENVQLQYHLMEYDCIDLVRAQLDVIAES